MSRSLPIPAVVLLACLGAPFGATAGLNEGEARAGAVIEAQTTSLATEVIALNNTQSTGSAIISGDMTSFNLTTGAWMSDTPLSVGTAASAAVDFYDTINLDVAGLPSNTPVRLRLAWSVGSGTTSSGTSNITISSRALLSGPDGQMWTRESNNSGDPVTHDPDGRVEFDFVLATDSLVPGNIHLTAATEAVAFVDVQNIPPSYNASPASNLNLTFLEVVSVETMNGTPLPVWTIESESLLDYGEGTGPLNPTSPDFFIGESSDDSHFINFWWQSALFEFYTIESSPNLATWTPEAQVNGDGSVISLDLIKPSKWRFYRLVSQLGSAPVGGTTPNPSPLLLPSPSGPDHVRIAWMTSIHESYTLQSSATPGSGWSSLPPQDGTGGAVFVDLPKAGPRHFYRILSGQIATP